MGKIGGFAQIAGVGELDGFDWNQINDKTSDPIIISSTIDLGHIDGMRGIAKGMIHAVTSQHGGVAKCKYRREHSTMGRQGQHYHLLFHYVNIILCAAIFQFQ